MDNLIYLILNKNNLDDNLNMFLSNKKKNYVLVDIKNVEKSHYDKKEKTIYVKDKKDKLKYSLYWIYKQKKYEFVYVVNDNNDINDILSDEYFFNYRFYTDKFKKENKISYPITNYLIDKKCLKILLSSVDKIELSNKKISSLLIKYKIILNKEKKNKNNLNKIKHNYKNILYLVLCCDNKPIYINNQKRIIEMLENTKVSYLLLKGNSNTTLYNQEYNTLFVDVEDIYENLPMKIYKGYEWIYKNTCFDYVYKIDDDFIFTDKNKIPDKPYDYYGNLIVKNLDRKWHFGKCSNNELNNLEYQGQFIAPYAAGGLGYILSRKSLEILIDNKEMFNKKYEIYEDKIVGDILYKNRILVNNLENQRTENTNIINYEKKKKKISLIN